MSNLTTNQKLSDLVVTLGGVPFADQAESLRQFKEACLRNSQRKDIKDMTPAEIYEKYGPDVADYILTLRSSVNVWKRIAADRLKVDPELLP